MNIFSFSGIKKEDGLVNYCANKLANDLSSKLKCERHIINASTIDIKPIESIETFESGVDSINDDMIHIKKSILNSEIIILATPVYLHSVSGIMKNFFDRIGYWTHILQLRGKIIIPITVCSTNGGRETHDYMSYISEQLGASVYQKVIIEYGFQDIESINSIIDMATERVFREVKLNSYKITKRQEDKYLFFKDKYLKNHLHPAEMMEWKKNKLFDYENYSELFNDYLTAEMKNLN